MVTGAEQSLQENTGEGCHQKVLGALAYCLRVASQSCSSPLYGQQLYFTICSGSARRLTSQRFPPSSPAASCTSRFPCFLCLTTGLWWSARSTGAEPGTSGRALGWSWAAPGRAGLQRGDLPEVQAPVPAGTEVLEEQSQPQVRPKKIWQCSSTESHGLELQPGLPEQQGQWHSSLLAQPHARTLPTKTSGTRP